MFPSGPDPLFVLMPKQAVGIPRVTEHVGCPVPPRYAAKEKKSGGSLVLAIGVRFLSLTVNSAGGSPMFGVSSFYSLFVFMSVVLVF